MKYVEDYTPGMTKEEFVKRFLAKYPTLTKKTAERRFYDVRKSVPQTPVAPRPTLLPKVETTYSNDEIKAVDPYKMLMINDMKRYGTKMTRSMLRKYGLIPMEINWLVHNKIITLEEEQK